MTSILARAKEYAKTFGLSDRNDSLLFIGKTGLGKTHISTAIAKEIIDKGYDVVYDTIGNIINTYEQQTFGHNEEAAATVNRYLECDLLIIDDLGTELTNQFTVSCLYNVINSRINAARSTFINTNLSQKDIETKYAERITSRIFGEYYPLAFKGIDVRKQKRT
jgi:DNA replication protein DnaC